jgi:hypothetical protein
MYECNCVIVQLCNKIGTVVVVVVVVVMVDLLFTC